MEKILLIDDEADVRYSFRRIFNEPSISLSAASSGEEGLRVIPQFQPDLVIMDVRMGGISGLETLRRIRQIDAKLPVIMMTAYGTTQTAIEAMKLGAFDYLLKPFDVPKLKDVVFNALKAARAMKEVVACQPLLESEDFDTGIVGRSEAMQKVFKLIGQLADSDATALITGESGTGKELVARAIYCHSRRGDRPFLAINCAAIPEPLLESELFGHEKGAFTGAAALRVGKFEQCNQGTIFLDEIGDMLPATQTKILRVLQSGTFERVGGNRSIETDVRIIAATNQPLERAVAEKRFREDLFYRLNVVRIHLPALRERREDISLLVNYFLEKHRQRSGQRQKSIAPEAVLLLERYLWPGNVRELENVIQRALVMAKGDAILPADLPAEIVGPQASPTQNITARATEPIAPMRAPAITEPEPEPEPESKTGANAPAVNLPSLARQLFDWARNDAGRKVLPAVERELTICALRETSGNQVQAAKILGITRATLRKRMEKFRIRQQISID